MSDYMGDLAMYYGLRSNSADRATAGKVEGTDVKISETGDNAALDMTDFLMLMVAQFQNQSLDSTADTSDMLNQMVQMSVIQAITEISSKIETMTDASVMSYASSLVGKEVTIGEYNEEGILEEFTATITGTGVVDGEQVVFVGDDTYFLGSIMAVGKLPEQPIPEEGGETDGADGVDDSWVNGTGGTDGSSGTDASNGTDGSSGTDASNGADGASQAAGNGTPNEASDETADKATQASQSVETDNSVQPAGVVE